MSDEAFGEDPYNLNEFEEGHNEISDNISTVKRWWNPRGETRLQDSRNEGFIKITVKDSGCGMNQESIGRLFQKFSQVSGD